MEPRIKTISYFSTDGYATQAMKLRTSAEKYSVELDMTPVPPFGSWIQGVMYKPQFILNALNEIRFLGYAGVLWTDADSTFVRKVPWGELEGAELGFTRFQWSPNHKQEILTGTMFFANTDRVRAMVEEWVKETTKYKGSDTPEQDSFLVVWERWKGQVFLKDMGCEWCFIDDPAVFKMYPKAIPIILHGQYSRVFRKEEANKLVKAGKK